MAKNRTRKKNSNNNGNHDVSGMMLVVISAFLLLCIVIKPILGVFSEAIFGVMLGVFGIASYPMLLSTLLLGVFLLMRRPVTAGKKGVICTTLLVFFLLVILQLASTHHFLDNNFSSYISAVYSAKYSVGGVVMGVIAFGLQALLTEVVCYIIFSAATIITLLVMTSAISRLRNRAPRERKQKKRKGEVQPETTASRPDFRDAQSAQRVIQAMPRSGLFVGTIERSAPAISTESGTVTDLPSAERRVVSGYASSPVIEREANRAEDRHAAAAAAHFTLYNNKADIVKQNAAEFRRTRSDADERRSEYEEAEREYGFDDERGPSVAEPYVKVNADADKPRRLDYEGTPKNLHEMYFPPEKHIEFNDEGIETAGGDIRTTLEEHNYSRVSMDIEKLGGSKRAGFVPPVPPVAPVFGIPKDEDIEPVEQIIDASAPIAPAPSPAQSIEERFFNAASEQPKTLPLETPRLKQDDIIDAFELKGRLNNIAEMNNAASPEEDDREEILDGTNPIPVQTTSTYTRPTLDADERRVISDDILDGSLIIDNGPAVDLSETHDNVSDLINGDDLSGMYISADEPEKTEKTKSASKRQKSNAPIENQITIDNILKEKAEESVVTSNVRRYKKYNYAAPPIDLLKIYEKVESAEDELQANAQILEEVVTRFLKTQVKVINIVPGPQVTRYELDVPMGTSVNGIKTRTADIAYELAAPGGVRVEAPIPGKRAVGIEVPNRTSAIVGLREVVDSQAFMKPKSPLVFSVGKDIGGAIVVCDLEKVPHLLIAGQTGSGKSAGLNSLIVSLLYKSSPEDMRFILIDPKRVEFSKFRGMPHLLFEKTITEPHEALNALKWAANEMDRRYLILQKYSCSKLSEYNSLPEVANGTINKLPHIIVVVDELATLMQSQVAGEIESKISSIAALARAAGIHLIVATQRPSMDVITGTIKSNLTSRIAFKVPDATNSRIILDEIGAEALAGNGDMLFYPQEYSAPKRVQGSFVSGEEVLSVVSYLKENYECDFDEDAEQFVCGSTGGANGGGAMGGDGGESGLDPLTARIMSHAIKSKQISVSVVQRRFAIGYARAARIIDSLEDNGFIGPTTGNSKPRDVLMTAEQYREMFGHDPDDN